MAGRRIDQADFDNAVHLYLSGKTIKQAATQAGIGQSTLARELNRRGIEARRVNAWMNLPADEIAAKYRNGRSEYTLAKEYDVQRSSIRLVLQSRDIEPRSWSEAGRVRAAQMTAEQRAAQAAAANEAMRGRNATWEERCKYAASREKHPPRMSAHELRFAHFLSECDSPYRREVAVGPFNLDFAIGSVAVEILGGEWHAYKTGHAKRTPYILNQGWAIVFAWSTANCPLTVHAANYAVTYAQQVSRNPSLIGEYRVIRGDGELIASGRCDDGEFPGIPPARHCLDAAS